MNHATVDALLIVIGAIVVFVVAKTPDEAFSYAVSWWVFTRGVVCLRETRDRYRDWF